MLEEKIIGFAENGVYKITTEINEIKCGKYWAKDVPEFLGGECDGVYSGGDGSFIVCINKAQKEEILGYVKTLEEKGYKKFSESEMNGNLFFTYQNGENFVYAYYIDSLKTVKIIAEPYYEYVNFTPEVNRVKPAIVASSVCDRNFYIRLPDNTLVVIDGGWRIEDWKRFKYTELLTKMYEEMREILGGEEIIKVSLWISTHAHTDHNRVLEFLYKMPLKDKFDITQILYNFPCNHHLYEAEVAVSDDQLDEMQQNFDNFYKDAGVKFPYEKIFYNCPFRIYDTMNYENTCRDAFMQYNAIQIKAHDGMKLSLSGVDFEIIHTQDDDMPAIFNNNNNISIIIKMTYKGSSMLWLGDMCEIPSTSCVEMYGDFLKSDCMQVSHHGWNAATPEFYDIVRPSVLFWNNSEFGFKYSDKWQGYGKTKISTDLYNMDCVKRNIFCNRINMSYAYLPIEAKEKPVVSSDDCAIIASGVSDRIYMIRTPQNKLVVIDGGWRQEFWDDFKHEVLIERFYNEMSEILGGEVRIAAWISTNCYKHNNRFIEEFSKTRFKDLTFIDNIIYNFPNEEDYENFDNQKGYIDLLKKSFEDTGAKISIAQKGDTFDFDGLKAEILYSPNEEIYDNIADSSLVIKFSFGGSSAIFTGDMTDRISQFILSSDIDLKCDAVLVANHGWNNCGLLEFYEKCDAKLQLWANSEYGYQFFRKDEGYNKSDISTKIYNLKNCKLNVFCDQVKAQIFSFPIKTEELI